MPTKNWKFREWLYTVRPMRVAIYQDYVHNNGILHRALAQYFSAPPEYIDAADIIGGALNDADLFIMPGGADLYYCEKLNGGGNAAIRSFVEEGGTYLGICAGAYYACAAIDWAAGTTQMIKGPRELNLFNGEAIGPLFELIEDRSIERSWNGIADLVYDDGTLSIAGAVFYSGGPAFAGGTGHRVLACYADGSAAIVECVVGNGRAILVGPHLEADATRQPASLYRHRNSSFEWHNSIATRMSENPEPARRIWRAILERCTGAP